MTYETILCEDEGAIGWLTLDRPDDGEMFMPRRCHTARDCVDEMGRETRARVLVDTGATPVLGPRFRCDRRILSHAGELPAVPAFRGEACRSDHSRLGGAHGERRP